MRRRLVVDPIACDGHGICAELLPELIRLDDWGYPMIDAGPVPPHLEALARRAVAACPTLALRLSEVVAEVADAGGSGRRPGRPERPVRAR